MELEIRGGEHRYPEITALRGFSILTIVAMHLVQGWMNMPEWVNKAASLGGSGVHVFFFCSGFGLCISYSRKEIGYGSFLYGRLIKVYIPYIIVVLISFLIPMIQVAGDRGMALFSHILLFKMFIPQYEDSFGPFWFMSTLFQFYIVFILLYKLKRKSIKGFLFLGIGLSIFWWVCTAIMGLNEERVIGSFFFQYLWEFSLGMLMVDVVQKRDVIRVKNGLLLVIAIVGCALEGLLGFVGGWARAINDVPAFFGYCAIGLLIIQVPIIQKVLLWLGEISFEWYLVHILIFTVTCNLIGGYVGCMVAFALSVLVAYVYKLFLKKTIYRIRQR